MTTDDDGIIVDLAAIEAAAERLQGIARQTPLLESAALNELAGTRLLVKAEPLQLTGSFKFRGAYNCISQLDDDQRKRGVIAFSSGNHAQGVAAAARLLGTSAVIVMPDDAPAVKLAGTRAWGAEIIGYDRSDHDARETIAAEVSEARGLTMIRPFDDPRIIAGQGTLGRELMAQAEAVGVAPDFVLTPAGGGGLMSGVATAVKALAPDCTLVTAEPEGFDDTARSLAAGERQAVREGAESMCDALLAPQPGLLTFGYLRRLVSFGTVVSDGEAADAMRAVFQHLKLVVEPGGATAIAAVLSGKLDHGGKPVVAVASGGNVDPGLFARILNGEI